MLEGSWWRSGVIYQIYPRSFADSDGDGHGDLQGVIDHLDHLSWLGIDGIWLNPIHPSPNADWGYDVTDYMSVAPEFGDLGKLDLLVTEARARGIRTILDLVPNHTSDQHPWFVDARSDRAAAHRDWYVWADPKADGSPPNNWRSLLGDGPAWTFDQRTGQYYLHNFLAQQPDLNWWNEGVRRAFDQVLRFWFDRGIAGFRIDVAHGIVKDRALRDDPEASDEDHPRIRSHGLRPEHSMNQPEVHDVLKRWRAIADDYGQDRILMGETDVYDISELMRFYGSGVDELHLAQNFPFVFSDFGAGTRAEVEASEAAMPPSAWPVWAASNHDAGRFPTRWCGGDDRKIRSALMMLLTLRGTPILYYGDEIGMPEVDVPRDRILDPVGVSRSPADSGRDRDRTPMHWTGGSVGGFSRPGVEPWLPIGDTERCNVEDQRADSGSVLSLCRDLIALRRERDDLTMGAYRGLHAPQDIWAWKRGATTSVVVNASDDTATLTVDAAEVLIGTRRERDGERVSGRLELEPWEAAILDER